MGWMGMGWYGRASEWYGTVRAVWLRQGKAGKGMCRSGRWWVVWAEFELGCAGRKEVGGQAGRRAGAGESWELGELGGGNSRGRETERWRAAHTHALTRPHTTATNFPRLFIRPSLTPGLPRHYRRYLT